MELEKQLSHEQARVVACLMEKQLATPNNYPLTYNSLLLACNQKSNREPVMHLTEGQVKHIVSELEELAYARVEIGDRADKIFHKAPGAFNATREQQAVLAMLMLRAPLTLNDIKARTEKMVSFESIDAVQECVESLVNRRTPLAILIPKGAGRREDRYTHIVCGEPDLQEIESAIKENAHPASSSKAGKVDELELRISELENRIAELEKKA